MRGARIVEGYLMVGCLLLAIVGLGIGTVAAWGHVLRQWRCEADVGHP